MNHTTQSVKLTVKDLEPVERALKNTRDSMPFLIALTPTERRQIKRVVKRNWRWRS